MCVLMPGCVCGGVFVCCLFLPSGGFNRGVYSSAFYMTPGLAALACLLCSDQRLKLEHRKGCRSWSVCVYRLVLHTTNMYPQDESLHFRPNVLKLIKACRTVPGRLHRFLRVSKRPSISCLVHAFQPQTAPYGSTQMLARVATAL